MLIFSSYSSYSSSSSLNLNLKSTRRAPVDKSKIKTLHAQTESDSLTYLAVEIGALDKSPGGTETTQRLCQWTISMVHSLARHKEPKERIDAVVRASLEVVRGKILSGYEIHNLWGLLEAIFTRERTKYMQGPENERHKRGPIAASVREIMQGIGNG